MNAVSVLPILTEYIDAFDPKRRARCDGVRYSVATEALNYIDNMAIRLRAEEKGRAAIDALQNAVHRIGVASNDTAKSERAVDLELLFINSAKGVNETDREIRDTLKARHNIEISDNELEKFVNFLVSFDPGYPSWSYVATYSVPMLLKDSNRYYQAYLRFKSRH
jgi:hypothetical protein